MADDQKSRADARLDTALSDADRRDPRPYYRTALRHLRERDASAFERAIRHFQDVLVPAVAGEADPLAAWDAYGALLARELGAGRTVELDSTGRARPVQEVGAARGLVLFIPDAADAPVLVLRYPRDVSPSQHAAYELLVEGRQTASAYG